MSVTLLLVTLLRFYSWLIIAYVIMSWIPAGGIVADIYRALGSICEPYLGLFRRFIPPLGMVDISPIVAILVLNIATSLVASLGL